MRLQPDPDEQLVGRLLRESERSPASPASEDHPDEERLALFATGGLRGEVRAEVIRHLADCPDCREIARLVLSLPAVPHRAVARRPRPDWRWVAAAASIAAMAGLVLLRGTVRDPSRGEQEAFAQARVWLRAGKFVQARQAIARAEAQGIRSDRLRNLDAQALRRIPGPIALALEGRLTDFGYSMDGVTAREPGGPGRPGSAREAYDALAHSEVTNFETLLNLGHYLLTLGRAAEALARFRAAEALRPSDPLAWLGRGIAQFELDDFKSAEESFRECLRLAPENRSARLNLAMTLDERGEAKPALAEWEKLLDGASPESERRQIRRRVEEIRHQLGGVP